MTPITPIIFMSVGDVQWIPETYLPTGVVKLIVKRVESELGAEFACKVEHMTGAPGLRVERVK